MPVSVAHAQSDATAAAHSFVATFTDVILSPLITLMMAVALLIFLWGCYEFIIGAADPSARQKGRQHILWGVIGFVVMVAAYALLQLASNTVGVDPDEYRTERTQTFQG